MLKLAIVLLSILINLSGCIMTPGEYAKSNTHVARPAPIEVVNARLEYDHIIKYAVISGEIKNLSDTTLYQTTVIFNLYKNGYEIGTSQYQINEPLEPKKTRSFISRIHTEVPTDFELSETFAVYITEKN